MKNKINPVFDNFIMVSPKQIELAIYIRQFRRIHQLSQQQMADLCSLYGEPYNVKFTNFNISVYENCRQIPRPVKFQVLLNTMDLTEDML